MATTDPFQRDVQPSIAGGGSPVKLFASAGLEYRSSTLLVNTTGDPGQPAGVDLLVRVVPKGSAAPTSIDYSNRLYKVAPGDVMDLGALGNFESDTYVDGANGAAYSYVAEARIG
jgi:hypothetical protein